MHGEEITSKTRRRVPAQGPARLVDFVDGRAGPPTG